MRGRSCGLRASCAAGSASGPGAGDGPAERQAAIDYLDTDATGVPSPYDNSRIREAVGLMLGYPQFQEQ